MSIRPETAPLLQGVIFDLFGTLIRPQRLHVSAVGPNSSDAFEDVNTAGLLRWAAVRGLPIPPEAVEVVRDAMARAAERLGWPRDDAFLDEASGVFFQPEVGMVEAYPDSFDALVALREMGLRLGLISNASDHRLIEGVMARTGLAPYFDPIVSSAGYGRIKPDPGIFRCVVDRWRLPAERCVMVGDTLDADVGGAHAVGMRAILVTMDPNPHNVGIAKEFVPDAGAGSLKEAAEIIRRWMDPD